MKYRPGRLEIAFAACAVLWFVLLFVPGVDGFRSVAALTATALALIVFVRHWPRTVEKMLWRLRNRLLVAYLLIALVPMALLAGLTGWAGYVVLGQISVHLLTSQMNLRMNMLHGALRIMSSAPLGTGQQRRFMPQNLASTFPGLEIVEVDRGALHHWPETSTLQPPTVADPDVGGLSCAAGISTVGRM